MIGVISKESEKEIVREFFELFKVPWEFYDEDRHYSVVISTLESLKAADATLVVLYNSEKIKFDIDNGININTLPKGNVQLAYGGHQFPIYGNISSLDTSIDTVTRLEASTGPVVGIEINKDDSKIIRIGFDLFQEINFLLTSGQSVSFSHIPTLDLHISMLREWILEFGLPLVEIPPVPAGYNFSCCLTHDIDFTGIRMHKFDHTLLGFLYRASFGSLLHALKGEISWSKLCENWKAVFLLPAVYTGLAKDFWMQFNSYTEVEEDFPSTFFIIPFKNHAGINNGNPKHAIRAARYDVSDVKEEIQYLLSHGREIGVHGIDAWYDAEKGRKEFARIHEATEISEIGIRMHWLYFNNESPKYLEDAGFFYDSSVGYNDAIGYRGGTTQVYRPIGLKKLLELPLNVQDTALFFPDRMALSEEKAWPMIDALLENAERYGGVLTINWHDRSMVPERLWGDFYIKILENLKKSRVWIDKASHVVRWFNKRRSVLFEEVCFLQDSLKFHIVSKGDSDVPDLVLRVYLPKTGKVIDTNFSSLKEEHVDAYSTNFVNVQIPI
ncbi:MAG: hypothetical protein ACLQBC_11580 [Syntrophales bacterium]